MIINRNLANLTASLALTLLVAAPAVADDTELLLKTAASKGKPNVLFILDSSGSMNTLEKTIAFYDSAQVYTSTGGCNNNSYYWNDTGIPPACDASRAILKTDFVCTSAAIQVNGIGSYTGTVAQYRTGSGTGSKWQTLALNTPGATVECAADSGIHGDGTAGDVYAMGGTGGSEFTNDPDQEVSWESFPTNLTYTLYDGNYLNWRQAPAEDSIKRIDIVKTVLKKVLSAYEDVNLGLMRFNRVDGGPVVHAMQDLKLSRTALNNELDDITGVGNTPLSETLYEAALYWQGLEAHYGQTKVGDKIDVWSTDPLAINSGLPVVYTAPPTLVGNCPRNFNILLTDGLPKNDADTLGLAPDLPGWEAALGEGRTCDDYVDEGDCLDDVAEYLYKHDISPSAGVQTVKTYGVGFLASQDDMALMKHTAEITDSKFFLATDPESLATSLLSIFDEITEQSLTFTSPAVAVNAFNRTQNLNDLYMTVFETSNKAHWPGNLKKYRVVNSIISDANGDPAVDSLTGFFDDNAKSYWTVGTADGADVVVGGAANVLPEPGTRKVYTNNQSGSNINLISGVNVLTESNDSSFTATDFGLTGAAGEPSVSDMISWAKGADIQDLDGDPLTTARNMMGDPLHSQPAAVDYGTSGASDVVVFSATNDGYLHAINGATGVELWSFVPKELLNNFAKLYYNPTEKFKQYGIDGDITPVIFDQDGNGQIDGTNDFVYIVFGLRRGGNSYYALDVTNKNAPKMLWNLTYPGFGQSWSAPVVARVDTTEAGLNAQKAVVIIGGGYDTVHDSPPEPGIVDGEGAGVYMLDLKTGAEIWRAGIDAPADLTLNTTGREMSRSFPTRIKVIDINGDGFADRMYAADVGGQVWRFDIFAGQPAASLVAGGIIARFGFEGGDGTILTPATEGARRIYNSPDVSIFTDLQQDRRYIAVSIGTGYRAHPLNTNASDTFYSLRDPDVFKQLSQSDYTAYDIAEDSDLVPINGKTKTVITAAQRGWKFQMPATQMVLADATTFSDSVFFVGFSPEANNVDPTNCDPTYGKNFLYQVSVVNGDPIVPNIDTLLPANSDAERVTALKQGGIAPTPTILFPSPDPACTLGIACHQPPLGCVGVECFDPGFRNLPVRTLWTQDGIE